jgi:hypothetical protein
MKEGFFILLVICVLAALTAARYRKQIAGMIGLARALKDAKDAALRGKQVGGEQPSVQLVNCAGCGVWVPQSKAILRQQTHYCADCR